MTALQLRLPCQEADSPDDWFINLHGTQYTDEEILELEDLVSIAEDVVARIGTVPGVANRILIEFDQAEQRLKKAALIRRRQAKDACFVECLFRERCLDKALTEGHEHGTWGGYYEEELRILRNRIARRQRRA